MGKRGRDNCGQNIQLVTTARGILNTLSLNLSQFLVQKHWSAYGDTFSEWIREKRQHPHLSAPGLPSTAVVMGRSSASSFRQPSLCPCPVVFGQGVLEPEAAYRTLLKMQILRPHSGSTESEILGIGTQQSVVQQTYQVNLMYNKV